MISVRFNNAQLAKVLNNTTKYGKGFTDGIEMDRYFFMSELAEYTIQALKKYIDSQAKASPDSLHHVYEWGQVGSPSARLFEIDPIVTSSYIRFAGYFLPSNSISDTATEPFIYKAETMENGITIVVAPAMADYLRFEVNDQIVFTKSAVTIEHPGGDAVAGSFGRVVDTFFTAYFTNALLQPFLKELATAEEFSQYFPQGAKGGGYSVGFKAGKAYIRSAGMKIA